MNKTVEMVVGAIGGASASEILKKAIAEAEMVFAFEYVSKELASTMVELLPIVTEIESMESVEELKTLMDTIDKARVLVKECSGVQKWSIHLKSYYTRRVEKINRKMVKFCQVQLPLLLLRNQRKYSTHTQEAITNCIQTISKRIDLMDVPAPVYRKLCSVPVYRKLCSVPRLDDKVPVGLDWPLMMLKRKLLDDSVESLLVAAAPGCGKTTLVTQLCHDRDIKGKFKHIFYIVVSSTPKFRVIVQDLLLHNGYEGVSFENDVQAANGLIYLIEKLIEDGPILLVMDDVWLGAESLLHKFRIRLQGYKILVTSRFDLPGFGYTYHLKPLEDKYAKALLVDVAPRPYNASQAEYEELLQKILKRCSGFPLVIEVVGVPLKGKPIYLWNGLVESWSEWETILDSPSLIEDLQPSFSALKPQLKDCFMDMGSFLEDQKIRASVIIDIWVELYGKGTSTSSIAYMKYLNDLASQNLLKLIPLGRYEHEVGFYNEFVVTQHDILRELAIHQSKSEAIQERKRLSLVIQGDNYPDLCLNQRESARFLSISTDDLFSSSWLEMELFQFPNVEALLFNISSSNYALPSFIATMKKLKVVIIINHGLDPAELTNLSCLSSLPKLKRIIWEKVSITFLDILQLLPSSLKKLSLFKCCFGEVSYDENEIDVSKSLSSLKEIDIDCCYDLSELPYWISEAVSLETLSITKCDNLSILPEAIGNLSKLQVLRLCSCIKLSELPENAVRLSNLQFLDISHCSGLRKLPLEIGKLQKLKRISMRNCGKCELPDSVKNLENLEVKCDEKTAFLWERLKPKMRNLRVQEEETEHNLNLQPSFSALEPNLKECFLDMGSFLEDRKIRASVIIDIWVEIYGKSDIVCMKYLEVLASQSLLKLVPLGNEQEDGFYNEFLVTQHDILRELAIHQSELKENLERKRLNLEIREDKFPDWCLNPRHPIINASLLSISTDDLFSSNWVQMDCPNVEALLLNISSSNYALPSFIATMKKLKVLIIINHGLDPAKLTNLSFLSSLPKLKRISLEKVSITFLDILQLLPGSLKKLSLFMCCFGEVFYDKNEIDVSKALSSLKEIDMNYCYDLSELPYWICEAVSLETLSFTNCNKLSILPEAIGNLSKLRELRLCSCINLSELPETVVRLSNLQFLDISHCLGLRKLPLEMGKLQKLKKISMRNCGKCELPDSVKNLENLEVKCDEETAFLWERLKPKMRNLSIQKEETNHNLNLLKYQDC